MGVGRLAQGSEAHFEAAAGQTEYCNRNSQSHYWPSILKRWAFWRRGKCRGWPWRIPNYGVVQVVAQIHMMHDDWPRGCEVPSSR